MCKRFISIILSLLLIASIGTLSAFSAAANDPDSGKDRVPERLKYDLDLATVGDDDFAPASQEDEYDMIAQAEQLPSSIDLRDYNGLNYVTPVKFQNPFGTCWAFGIAAASEISFLYANGLGVPAGEENNTVDFSEKYISWYMYHAITEDDVMTGAVRASQVGEGFDVTEAESEDINAVYSFGGFASYASNFFASGHGPVTEDYPIDDSYPYYYAGNNRWRQSDRNESEEVAVLRKAFFKNTYRSAIASLIAGGYFENEDEYDEWFDTNWGPGFNLYEKSFTRANYAGYDDWSLPLNAEYRFPGVVSYFKNSYVLPEINDRDSDGNYVFKEVGLAAIKLELSKGHGVALSYLADQSQPDQEAGDEGYMNTVNWAQYYTGQKQSNHAVTIVGYDDNYPKENFTRKVKGEVVEGSTPPGDGALIIKNSWGALTEEDKATVTYDIDGNPVYQNPNANAWGYEDTGYFYLSYYDQSISRTETYEFYTDDEVAYEELNYDQYDLLQGNTYSDFSFETDLSMANVFDAEEDEILYQISYMTAVPKTIVHYAVYKDVEDGDPTSGILLEEGENANKLGGYQRFDLKNKYFLSKGEKYSVVITQQRAAEQGEKHDLILSYAFEDRPDATINAVVNEGESYLYDKGEWCDLSVDDMKAFCVNLAYNQLVEEYGKEDIDETLPRGKDSIAVDNFPIKAFLIPADVYGFNYLVGDADCDNEVTILDATHIQRELAGLKRLNETGKILADVDRDNEMTIFDASYVQRHIASLPCPEGIGMPYVSKPDADAGD